MLAPFSDNEQLGRGAVISPRAIPAFVAVAPLCFDPPAAGDILVRFRPGVSKEQGIAALSRRLGGPGQVSVFASTAPAEVANFGQVNNLP